MMASGEGSRMGNGQQQLVSYKSGLAQDGQDFCVMLPPAD